MEERAMRRHLRRAFGGVALIGCGIAFVFACWTSWGQPAAGGDASLGDGFVEALKDFCKAVDRAQDNTLKLRAAKKMEEAASSTNQEASQKLYEKVVENLEDAKRELNVLNEETKSQAEQSVRAFASWALGWSGVYAGISSHARFDMNGRWADHYAKRIDVLVVALKKTARDKRWGGITCGACAGGMVDCPSCGGTGACGAQVLSDETCQGGYFRATHARLCPVCQGTAVCLVCEGTKKMLCPIDHRLLER